MNNRAILHLDLDAFFVSVERLKNPSLRNVPLIVGGSAERGVVAAASYEARRFGVHSAMPARIAKQLCPEAIFIKGDYDAYSRFSDLVTDVIVERSPVVEKASIDEFYVDMTGMERFYGCLKWGSELKAAIKREAGLDITFGLSGNKTVSKIAVNEAKPNGQMQIDYGLEKPFLAPLSIKKIPMVGDKIYHLLRSMGVAKINTLQAMPIEMLQRVMGEGGKTLWAKANGIDQSPVEPYVAQKSISTEHTFQKDTIDVRGLQATLVSMAESLGYQLRQQEKLTACLTLKIRYSDFNTYTMQVRLPYTSLDNALVERAKELFRKLYQRRLLIRLIGLKVSHLVQGSYQYTLFEDVGQQVRLYHALDTIRNRYGVQAVGRAASAGLAYSQHETTGGKQTVPQDFGPAAKSKLSEYVA